MSFTFKKYIIIVILVDFLCEFPLSSLRGGGRISSYGEDYQSGETKEKGKEGFGEAMSVPSYPPFNIKIKKKGGILGNSIHA